MATAEQQPPSSPPIEIIPRKGYAPKAQLLPFDRAVRIGNFCHHVTSAVQHCVVGRPVTEDHIGRALAAARMLRAELAALEVHLTEAAGESA